VPPRRARRARTRSTVRSPVRRRAPSVAPPSAAPAPVAAVTAPTAPLVEAQGLPIVRELARIARSAEPAAVRLEGALEILFGAYGTAESDFPDLMMGGWVQARADKQFRLTMAWVREQLRLSLEEIVVAGQHEGRFRSGIDPGSIAALMVAAAEGCLLQSPTHGGTVPPGDVVKALLGLLRG